MKVHHHRPRRPITAPMTPMIDVVFLLLIFFICTASFTPVEAVLPGRLSAAGASAEPLPIDPNERRQERVVVGVPADAAPFIVNGARCATLELLAASLAELARADGSRPVVLDVDRRACMGRAIDVFDECRRAGFTNVQFAVRK